MPAKKKVTRKKSTKRKTTARKKRAPKKKTAKKKTARRTTKKRKARKKTVKKKTTRKKATKKRATKKKTKKSAAKRTRRKKVPPEEVMSSPPVVGLLQKGLQTGFVTEEEILHAIPEVEEHIDALELFYDALEKEGIRVEEPQDNLIGYDLPDTLPTKRKAREQERQMDNIIDVSNISDD